MAGRDWVKIIAIILAIVFFLFWIIGTNSTSNETELVFQQYQNLYDSCNISLQNTIQTCKVSYSTLNSQWQSAFDTLSDCYVNNVPLCNYHYPIVNLTE